MTQQVMNNNNDDDNDNDNANFSDIFSEMKSGQARL